MSVSKTTLVVTYCNAPHQERLRQQYEHLPDSLQQDVIEPTLPWLYGFKLEFRFRLFSSLRLSRVKFSTAPKSLPKGLENSAQGFVCV
jgi:hypothetical protein